MEGRPVIPSGLGESAFCRIAPSGIASTSPSPNKGVVCRWAVTLASAGTTFLQSGSKADLCHNQPPHCSSGLKMPIPVRPQLGLFGALLPPGAGTEGHTTAETVL